MWGLTRRGGPETSRASERTTGLQHEGISFLQGFLCSESNPSLLRGRREWVAGIPRPPSVLTLPGCTFPIQKWEKFNLFLVKQILPWAFLRGSAQAFCGIKKRSTTGDVRTPELLYEYLRVEHISGLVLDGIPGHSNQAQSTGNS